MPSRFLLPAAARYYSPTRSLRTILLGAVLALPVITVQACPISDTAGKTCSSTATTAIAPVKSGVGNPINTMTGNKYQREVDMPPLPGVLGLEIIRHYNSDLSKASMIPGIIGRGWKLSYETELERDGNNLQVREADGTLHRFICDAVDTTHCDSDDHTEGTIEKQIKSLASDNTYRWVRSNGQVMLFNLAGNLLQIEAPTGEFVSLQYDARNLLMKVTDPQGRELRLHHLSQ